MRALVVTLAAVIALGLLVIGLALGGVKPFGEELTSASEPLAPDGTVVGRPGASCPAGRAPRARLNRVSERGITRRLDAQLALGPRPAGSARARRLAADLRRALPNGRYGPVPGGLRNVIGEVPGRDPGRFVVVGAHYDTKDLPGFVGANDGAGGTAAVVEIARRLRPRTIGPTVRFVLFDGEESPAGTPDSSFEERGLRGSRAEARAERGAAEAMILLDFIGDRRLAIPREGNSDRDLWAKLRAAARTAGVGCVFPARSRGPISDDHVPFLATDVPAIDLIDFEFDCFHRRCDNRSAVSIRSLDASAEAVAELLRRL
jgi:hypothetical protein